MKTFVVLNSYKQLIDIQMLTTRQKDLMKRSFHLSDLPKQEIQ